MNLNTSLLQYQYHELQTWTPQYGSNTSIEDMNNKFEQYIVFPLLT